MAKTKAGTLRIGKNGSKRHLLLDGRGIPLSLITTGANCHDVTQLDAMVDGVQVQRLMPPQRRHKYLCADNGYRGTPDLATIALHD